MTTTSDLELALKDAMRASDTVRKNTIRMALTAIKLTQVDKGQPLDETDVNVILQKEVKSRREAIADAEKASRPDLISEAEAEIAVLEEYLPQPLSDAEIESLVRAAIAEVGASSPKEMGAVMKVVMPQVAGRAAGNQVSQVVRQLLAG